MKQDIEQAMEKYGDMVYRIALTHTGSPENAEDIFQDVFIAYSEKFIKSIKEDKMRSRGLVIGLQCFLSALIIRLILNYKTSFSKKAL